ncbi:hypothetical protein CLV83_1779 [Marinobacterium mangrovicola]|uniref:Lipoprotein LPP20-like domain-containing protein n=1 Tax=Marinobacterium mangrovicola TaxID=1476959 RepID=A0A4R1GLF2_9GAMM|nr:LPP20 family lipoprotein [Marinobacterium mangrovicola]TCK06929.1 hypothetical protein CLV83_1779 [Marinobacterium mangrovicola]
MVKKLNFVCALLALVMLSGCETIAQGFSDTVDAMPDVDHTPRIEKSAQPHWVSATGYAPISLQPGETPQQKVLMAMRASKLRAYQELAGVIHGQYLYGTTQVDDMVVSNDRFKTAVAGIVRGARVVKSYPVQDDTYATVLEVDMNQVQRAWVRASE